jgi:hypothetical protein
MNTELRARLVGIRWWLMGLGAALYVGFGLTGGMLADAGWKRIGNALLALALLGWIIWALGVGLHVYNLWRTDTS